MLYTAESDKDGKCGLHCCSKHCQCHFERPEVFVFPSLTIHAVSLIDTYLCLKCPDDSNFDDQYVDELLLNYFFCFFCFLEIK